MKEFLLAFIPIFVAVDPIGLLPIVVGLTNGYDAPTKRKIIFESIVTALCLALGFMVAGRAVFRFLGVTVGDFMIAGGVVLFCIALMDLLSAQKRRRIPATDIGAVPIGTPLIAGPGLLTASLIVTDQHGFALTALSICINILLTGAMFLWSDVLMSRLGSGGARALSKIMSLLLAAFAVMMIRRGMGEIF